MVDFARPGEGEGITEMSKKWVILDGSMGEMPVEE
jgi:hypothetical protein